MRFRIPKERGGRLQKTEYVPACQWPGNVYARVGSIGGCGKVKTMSKQINRDKQEVADYVRLHPDATLFDISLECHMTDYHVRRILKEMGVTIR
jgi:hypothetical protein